MSSDATSAVAEAVGAAGPLRSVPRGNSLARAILARAGWKVRFHGLPASCGVVIVYPHTSNWDFVTLILAKWTIGLDAAYLTKDTLFRVPGLGALLRASGGIPVERSTPHGVIGEMARRLAAARERGESMWVAIAPEGTRAWRPSWKSGFYHMALAAGVPLGLTYVDYPHREVGLTEFVTLTGDVNVDMGRIAAYYRTHGHGLRPERAAPVRFENG